MNLVEEQIKLRIPPAKTESYSPIAHATFIKNIYEQAEELNLVITDASYQHDKDYTKVTGKYTIEMGDDDMGCMIAFQNSYDKSLSAKFAIGASVFICSNGMVVGDHAIKRKHTGNGPNEILEHMKESFRLTERHFHETIKIREDMKQVNLSDSALYELIGALFLEEEVIRTNQLSLIKQEYNKPTHDYGVDKNNLWNIYNLVTDSIERRSHPTLYLNQHEQITNIVRNKYLDPIPELC